MTGSAQRERRQIGLANHVCPDGEVLSAALAAAHKIAALPRQAVEATKRVLNLHVERAVLATIDFAMAAETESFDTPELRRTTRPLPEAVVGKKVDRERSTVAKRTRFAEYKDRYANYRFELSEEGILLMQCHTNGGSLVWDWKAHDEMSDAFADIAGDREIKVLIHTGTGENYNANWGAPPTASKPMYLAMDDQKGLAKLDEKAWYGRMLVENVLAVDVPMISAVNGPCNIHSEVPLLGDIVLASEDAYFQDLAHFPRGMVPGDGQHVIWPLLVGRNRARYMLLTGKKLSAQEALEWGAVNEVLPKDQLLDRAWELARELAKRPPLTLRYTRMLFTQDFKRAFLDELGHGLARETYAQRQFFPVGGGMTPLDRPWDKEPWSD